VRSTRFGVLILHKSMQTVSERTDEPTYTVTWDDADKIAHEAGYDGLPMGWTMANGEPCLRKTNNTQYHPPLKVTSTFKDWIIKHAACSGEKLPPH
jgi:hypothetical protein